ncbi:hypothetical protein Goklo_008322 [Gossypium klotzschianum]|uniref:RRM domain-containing protein n=1 Tax=Gossypium klotzschianum TaxID=34286 RepID=A0A7J8UZJ9_9ROSI|nr:hypothetical protein [Gossypium klotzschianum]
MDDFIPRKKIVEGKRFGFVRFAKRKDAVRVVERLNGSISEGQASNKGKNTHILQANRNEVEEALVSRYVLINKRWLPLEWWMM